MNINRQSRMVTKDFAYFEIKKKIINGELTPDQDVVEENLAIELGVSRTPLREALHRLEYEELVVRKTNGRLKVASISVKEAEEIFIVRSLLEGVVAKDSARNASKKDIDHLKDIVKMIEKAINEGRDGDLVYYGTQFHSYLYSISGNQTVIKILNMLNGHISRYRRLGLIENRVVHNEEDHGRILKYIINRDADGAEMAMRNHIQGSLTTAIEKIKKYKQNMLEDTAK